jgi:hypothetical protein
MIPESTAFEICGTWRGRYVHGSPSDDGAGAGVDFTMSLSNSSRGAFVGYARDDFGGMPERGRIRGRRLGIVLDFVRSIVLTHITDEDGELVPAHEFVATHYELQLQRCEHRIGYRGRLSESGQTAAGSWHVLPCLLRTTRGVYEIPRAGAGTWEAVRVSPKSTEV